MRRPLLAGNMKMFKTQREAEELAEGLASSLSGVKDRDICMCPPYASLHVLREVFDGTNIALGAQNLHWEKEGAFTGELSAEMLKDAGCSYIIVGHSERRQYFGETETTVNKKIKAVHRVHLKPIMCVGETLQERESGSTFNIIETQLTRGLADIRLTSPDQLVVAYEPVWAIGTGKTATTDQAQEVHVFIRKKLAGLFKNKAEEIRILYGGSVKPENIKGLMLQADIDGALVGGACLKADQFTAIVKY
ncbi:MAG: triose-phosphate isomerase [bacterium]